MDSNRTSKEAKRLYRLLAVVLVLWAAAVTPAAAQDGYQVVVNEDNPLDSLPKSELSKIFLGKVATWPNGQLARAVDQLPESEVRERFSKDVHGRFVPAIKNYWQRQIFSGRGTPPPELRAEEEILEYVRGSSGGVGYVRRGTTLGSGLKRLRVE